MAIGKGLVFDFDGFASNNSLSFITGFGGTVKPRFVVRRTRPWYAALRAAKGRVGLPAGAAEAGISVQAFAQARRGPSRLTACLPFQARPSPPEPNASQQVQSVTQSMNGDPEGRFSSRGNGSLSTAVEASGRSMTGFDGSRLGSGPRSRREGERAEQHWRGGRGISLACCPDHRGPLAGRCGIHDYVGQLASAFAATNGVHAEIVSHEDWSPRGVWRLLGRVRALGPDILHVQYPMIVGWRSLGPHSLGFLTPMPQVVTLHEFSSFDKLRRASMGAFAISAKRIVLTTIEPSSVLIPGPGLATHEADSLERHGCDSWWRSPVRRSPWPLLSRSDPTLMPPSSAPWRSARVIPIRPGAFWLWPRSMMGASRTEAAQIGCVTLQIVRDWVLRFNARGPEGLLTGRAPGAPASAQRPATRGPAGHRRSGPHPGHPRRGALALGRSDPVALGGVPPLHLQADAEPRAAGHGLSQALGPSAPSRQERGGGGRF